MGENRRRLAASGLPCAGEGTGPEVEGIKVRRYLVLALLCAMVMSLCMASGAMV